MATIPTSISYKFSMDLIQLAFFLEKVHDLTAIDNEILLKIDRRLKKEGYKFKNGDFIPPKVKKAK